MKRYFWPENLKDYSSDNEVNEAHETSQAIEIKRLNFFIGKNNSGKSRFLRGLLRNQYTLAEHNFPNFSELTNELQGIARGIDDYNVYHNDNDRFRPYFKKSLIDLLTQMNSVPRYPIYVYKKHFLALKAKLEEFRIGSSFSQSDKPWSDAINKLEKKIIQAANLPTEDLKYYIPILRGMRPISQSQQEYSYVKRTKKDYFNDETDRKGIITGESLYAELVECLLGEPEQRELIREYQNALGQYFFDGNEVTLIPKHKQDVVHIKIGDEAQRPIHDLGDGLQQVIILTYQAFITKNKRHMFFIEEPELHMHAGMVRQLMNFYLNETEHYYFFTTHSNHLLDMADESDEVMIQKFVKQPKAGNSKESEFKIYRCGRDRDLLASLGVKPSSVYLANCTIWVEGITDRLYIVKYMQKYLDQLKEQEPDKYKKYLRFMPNYHYAFVEYSGGNIVHWSFSDDYADALEDKGLSAKAVASDMLLIADGDNREKAARIRELTEELGKDNLYILRCKEIENTLPFNAIVSVAKSRFERMNTETKEGFDISKLDELDQDDYFMHEEKGIGFLLDTQIRLSGTKKVFNDSAGENGAGTIKNKLPFCRGIVEYFDEHEDWELTDSARELCEKIYEHIERCNA